MPAFHTYCAQSRDELRVCVCQKEEDFILVVYIKLDCSKHVSDHYGIPYKQISSSKFSYFSKNFYHKKIQEPILNDASFAPTSDVDLRVW